MNSWHRINADSSTLLGRTGIRRRVLHRLLTAARLGIGFNVLDVGCEGGELAAYLDSLGIQCAGISESPVDVLAARKQVPTSEFHCAAVGDPLPGLQIEFDLVLVRSASVYLCPMLSRAAFAATIHLLKHVRPGGCLAFLTRGGGSRTAAGHAFSCFARHVASLPGRSELHEFLGRSGLSADAGGEGIAVLRLPPQRLTNTDWKFAIDRAVQPDHAPCCHWAARQAARDSQPISRAA